MDIFTRTTEQKKIRELWQGGFDKFQDIFGKSIAEFEMEWLDYVSKIEYSKEIDWTELMEKGRG